jgi:hypothetical protein
VSGPDGGRRERGDVARAPIVRRLSTIGPQHAESAGGRTIVPVACAVGATATANATHPPTGEVNAPANGAPIGTRLMSRGR